jgi:hypothetical protein
MGAKRLKTKGALDNKLQAKRSGSVIAPVFAIHQFPTGSVKDVFGEEITPGVTGLEGNPASEFMPLTVLRDIRTNR